MEWILIIHASINIIMIEIIFFYLSLFLIKDLKFEIKISDEEKERFSRVFKILVMLILLFIYFIGYGYRLYFVIILILFNTIMIIIFNKIIKKEKIEKYIDNTDFILAYLSTIYCIYWLYMIIKI